MITLREESFRDVPAREALLEACFGDGRFEKTCERLREGCKPAEHLSLVMENDGELIGTVRLWPMSAGPHRPALLLGPLAIDRRFQGLGLGARLMGEALRRAKALGHRAVLLVGDASYYARFGFLAEMTQGLRLPGPYEPERFLALELVSGALHAASGFVSPTGARAMPSALEAKVSRAAALRKAA